MLTVRTLVPATASNQASLSHESAAVSTSCGDMTKRQRKMKLMW